MNDEQVAIVDENDEVISVQWRNSLRIEKGNYLRYVNIFVINSKDELLMPIMSMNRRLFPGCFDFSVAEHVMAGESYDEAATRGLKEELNLEGTNLRKIGKVTPKEDMSGFAMTYELVHNGSVPDYDRDGITGLRWIPITEVLELWSKDKSKFKGDFIQNFNYWIKNRNKKKD